jgi:hypothetical protein
MPLVVANDYDTDRLYMRLIKEVVRKTFKVGTPETMCGQRKSQRFPRRATNGRAEFALKLVCQPQGYISVIAKNF